MQASTLVIFGATGDLTHRKLVPALYNLFREKLLPEDFNIVGFARRDQSSKTFSEGLKEWLKETDSFEEKVWDEFSQHLHYVQGDFDTQKDFVKLAQYLKKFDPEVSCTNKIFYLSTAPEYFAKIINNLDSTEVFDLLGECWKRIIVEKPFGSDLASAKELNQLVDSKFKEDEIYRIDHYLAKETVQNILAFRFANGLFEPIWNKDFIDHIQITAAEEIGVENRGGYYDQSGNLRDIVQNHLLQLLALTTMEQPADLEAEAIRDARLKALKSLKKLSGEEIKENVVFGQYEGYLEEEKVNQDSKTDTFSALKVFLDSPRFEGVPIYLRSGKKLPEKSVYICVAFKEPGNKLFEGLTIPNVLTFFIQPDSTISLRLMAKKPGHDLTMEPVNMHLRYTEVFKTEEPEAYEKLLLDIVGGVQTYFPRADEVEASWEFIDPILKEKSNLSVEIYSQGSWGPQSAQVLIKKDNKDWFAK